MAHDAMMANDDRQFREIPVFLSGIPNLGKCTTLRIFEVEENLNGTQVVAHQMGPDSSAVDQDMTLLVHSGHVGMLLPTTETTHKEWAEWKTQTNRVCEYDWGNWEVVLAKGESPPTSYTLETCAVCGQNARLPKRACFNPIGGCVDSDDNEFGKARRGRWNPWIYQKPMEPSNHTMPFCNMKVNPPRLPGTWTSHNTGSKRSWY